MTKTTICSIRRMINEVSSVFDEDCYIEFYSDGSGWIKFHEEELNIEFYGLGELATILEKNTNK